MTRTAKVVRATKETDIGLSIDLDGTGAADIATCWVGISWCGRCATSRICAPPRRPGQSLSSRASCLNRESSYSGGMQFGRPCGRPIAVGALFAEGAYNVMPRLQSPPSLAARFRRFSMVPCTRCGA